MFGDETQVPAPGLHILGFGFEFGAELMEIYLLGAEGEGVAGVVEWVSRSTFCLDTASSLKLLGEGKDGDFGSFFLKSCKDGADGAAPMRSTYRCCPAGPNVSCFMPSRVV